MVKIPIRNRERTMTQLPLNDPQVEPRRCEFASPGMPEPVKMHPLTDTCLLGVTLEHFPHVGVGEATAPVRTKQNVTLSPANGKPFVHLPDGFVVDADHTTLTALTLQYSDGSSITVNVADSKIESLVAPKLTTKVDSDESPVAGSSRGWWKRLEDLAKRLIPEDLCREC